jgi:hypothetical protein
MKIYTRTGDAGETSLFAGGRVSKGHVRLHVCGTIDELNAVLGLALAVSLDESLRAPVRRVQSDLFVVGADLATPLDAQTGRVVRVSPRMVERLEDEIDAWVFASSPDGMPPCRAMAGHPPGDGAGQFGSVTVCESAFGLAVRFGPSGEYAGRADGDDLAEV